jgi:UDP-galactopyranose mutase
MVTACGDRLRIELNTDYRKVMEKVSWKHLIFTGPIDAFFDYKFGPLPYRTLRFEHEFSPEAETCQPSVQVNFTGQEPFTRCVEAKHITGQQVRGSTVIREFPEAFEPGKEPFYPIPAVEARLQYSKYAELAKGLDKVTFLGRLGTYRYYNMDQVVGAALAMTEDINI